MSGIFGLASSENCAEKLMYGIDYHSHLGTEFGGMALLDREFVRRIHSLGADQFKSKFAGELQYMPGHLGVGVISDNQEQPMYLNSRLGPFCLVTSGMITNADTLAANLMSRGISFSEMANGSINTTELVAKLISLGNTIAGGIEGMFKDIEGSCSLLLLHRDGIYAARDHNGYTPLIVGRNGKSWAVTSETTAFYNLDFKIEKYLAPGEIVLINHDTGMVQKSAGQPGTRICSFLWIYTGFPASDYEGINAEIVRENCGRFLAQQDQGLKVDLVSGVPDSGVAHGLGYAIESKVPFRRPLVKYTPGYGRSYTPPSQATRDLVAKMKLVAIAEVIKGNRIVLCEDSIVRGTQLKNFTVKKLWDNGAKEIHVRPACPPLMFPCKFNLSTRSLDELVARRAICDMEGAVIEDVSDYLDSKNPKYQKLMDWIAKDLEVTSVKYLTIDDMVAAIGLPREKLCLYCWNGQCPKDSASG
ncbi:amidophosphoribosyltransferase [bacterium]|nr:amidophosphoribosyltransferase [bacterium]